MPEVKHTILTIFACQLRGPKYIGLASHWREFRDSAVARYEQTVTVPVDKLIAVLKEIGSWQK